MPTPVDFEQQWSRAPLPLCQFASNRDPHFASNIDPLWVMELGISMECIGEALAGVAFHCADGGGLREAPVPPRG